MSKRYSGKSFKDASVMKKAKLKANAIIKIGFFLPYVS